MKVFLSLGANLGDREENIKQALARLKAGCVTIEAISDIFETPALIHPKSRVQSQPPYCNALALVSTSLSPHGLLTFLLEIESALGRVRTEKWGSRTIDLDIIGIGSAVIFTPTLIVPHPEMHRRSFVLKPLVEISPRWVHPLLEKPAQQLLEAL